MSRTPVVVTITADDTHDLRRRVLRDVAADDAAVADVEWEGDNLADTTHFGIEVDGRIVAISTWLSSPDPDDPLVPAVQLRGMATDPEYVSQGFGAMLLQAGRRHARSIGAEVVWANARVSALGFYERAGFDVVGPVFVTAATGLEHRLVRDRASSARH